MNLQHASPSAHQIPAGRGFYPEFHPSQKSLLQFSWGTGPQPNPRGAGSSCSSWFLRAPGAWALLSLGSGSFYRAGNPQKGFAQTEKSIFLTFNRCQVSSLGNGTSLSFLVKTKAPTQKTTPHKKSEPNWQKKPHGPKPQQTSVFNLSLLFKRT